MIPYKQLPKDGGQSPMQEFPTPFKALANLTSDNSSASSVITLNDNCSTIEVYAGGQPAAVRWVPVTETAAVAPAGSVITAPATANFDNTVAKDTVRRFAVPIEAMVLQASIVGLNKQYGLYNRVAVKSFGVGSVWLTQY